MFSLYFFSDQFKDIDGLYIHFCQLHGIMSFGRTVVEFLHRTLLDKKKFKRKEKKYVRRLNRFLKKCGYKPGMDLDENKEFPSRFNVKGSVSAQIFKNFHELKNKIPFHKNVFRIMSHMWKLLKLTYKWKLNEYEQFACLSIF